MGLGARDTLRLEVNYHLYGNDMDETRNPIEAGLGWACKEDTGFVGVGGRRPRPRRGHRGVARRLRLTGPGIARQGNPIDPPPGVVTCGTMSPSLGVGIGMAYVPAGRTEPGTALRSTCAGSPATPRSAPNPCIRRPMADYPADLKYHAEHDWARIEGDSATLGITWYAQDSLGEIVFFEPPEVGATITKDEPYAEVESVKAVSDVIAPLSGEVIEVNAALGRTRRRSTTRPTTTAGS